jgi:Protein of unknown function (DUF4239)
VRFVVGPSGLSNVSDGATLTCEEIEEQIMESIFTACIVSAALLAAVGFGRLLGRVLPEHHRSPDTRDSVKLAVGLVATMSALLLGLLIRSANGSYDQLRNEVIQMSAKIAFLDRVLELYGPETAESRAQLRAVVDEMIPRIWPDKSGVPGRLDPNIASADKLYGSVQSLVPRNDTQRDLKKQATTLMVEIGQIRWLLEAQSVSSTPKPLLVVMTCWLVVIFLGFSVLAPRNATATIALVVSSFSAAGAIFLLTEFNQPFSGIIRISSEPMQNALKHFVH